jgi:hypothetical protein
MYWLGQEANDQILDLLNARLDQSSQLGRIQVWRLFRDELEPRNHKRANRSDEAPHLPADEITPREHAQHDMRYVGLVLLMFLWWLVYFVGPAVISDVPSDHMVSASEYYRLVPALAVALTGAVLAREEAQRRVGRWFGSRELTNEARPPQTNITHPGTACDTISHSAAVEVAGRSRRPYRGMHSLGRFGRQPTAGSCVVIRPHLECLH